MVIFSREERKFLKCSRGLCKQGLFETMESEPSTRRSVCSVTPGGIWGWVVRDVERMLQILFLRKYPLPRASPPPASLLIDALSMIKVEKCGNPYPPLKPGARIICCSGKASISFCCQKLILQTFT